jgi:acyl-coenzyme A synthetase/AMP-(fatty) acid ligase
MNCLNLAADQLQHRKDEMALWTEKDGAVSFGEMGLLTRRAQSMLLRQGLGRGDHILIFAMPSPQLYAMIMAILGIGATVMLVEPWMPIERVDHVVRTTKPKAFYAGFLGRLWGWRVKAIREIPLHLGFRSFETEAPLDQLVIESMEGHERGIITFSSGTSAAPKGVVRTQQYLEDINRIINKYEPPDAQRRPDLCIFANLTTLHLANGRAALIVPHHWKKKSLARIAALADAYQPVSMTCGPAFLRHLVETPQAPFAKLEQIGVGGALTPNSLFEAAFARWPGAKFTHIYGGSEVEPVAHCDAREAVERSRARGFYHALYVGHAIEELGVDLSDEKGPWVAGPNVCPEYVGANDENKKYKRRDADGRLWHFMGDRLEDTPEGFYYAGRSFQESGVFAMEQRVYAHLDRDRLFLHRDAHGRLCAIGEAVKRDLAAIQAVAPEVQRAFDVKLTVDRRHRARIDRAPALKKAESWLAG